MKFRLHPILLPVFLFLLVSGDISLYTLIFLSLLIHEAGHLVAAYAIGMRVKSCTIMPYGGELVIPGRLTSRRRDRLFLALSGPAATFILLILSVVITFPGNDIVVQIQLFLLALNLLPILPLDGGQALTAILETKGHEYTTRTAMLVQSMIVLLAAIIVLSLYLPKTLPYIFLAVFLLIQNYDVFRFRKYEQAFINITTNRLTN